MITASTNEYLLIRVTEHNFFGKAGGVADLRGLNLVRVLTQRERKEEVRLFPGAFSTALQE